MNGWRHFNERDSFRAYLDLPTKVHAGVSDYSQQSAPRLTTYYIAAAGCRHWYRQLPYRFRTLDSAKQAAFWFAIQVPPCNDIINGDVSPCRQIFEIDTAIPTEYADPVDVEDGRGK